MNKKKIVLLVVFLCVFLPHLIAQEEFDAKLEDGMKKLDSSVHSIGRKACGLVGAIIGLIAIGRAAWKFSNGEHGAVMALLEGVIAIVLAQIAAGFFR